MSKITKDYFETRGIYVNNYAALRSALLLAEPVIIVADFMDLNRCDEIRREMEHGESLEIF